MNRPEIVSVGVVWDSERPTLDHIMDVFATVGTTLRLGDVFHSVVDNRWAQTTSHNLVGVVTYYGKHYSTFFFHTKLRVWIYFDDATVREVGPRWEQVVEKCRRGRYQPLLLLYAVPGGTPVNVENAPKTVTPFYTDKNLSKKPPVSQSMIRRSVTPSPEKPNIGNTRRAITPNPDGYNQRPLSRPYNDYQNLSIIQDNLNGSQGTDTVDGEPSYISRKTVETVLNAQHTKLYPVQRTLSNGSSTSNGDGLSISEHHNIPRRRDSGNWSGDRNSASSSSSTTMENPYLYLVGKLHRNGSVPGSPTRVKPGDSSSGSSGMYDAGYDSYSLSSNDSLPIQQGLKHNLQLAKIPEGYQTNISTCRPPNSPVAPNGTIVDDCEKLCREADQLLDKSRMAEDLETALVLCNAAATKARAAMDAPYNNPNAMVFARMKHNTCVMRARGLHRRMLQEQGEKETPDIRHSRDGSTGSGRHSRQNSRDKGNHSRQNSKELLRQNSKENILNVQPVVEKVSPKNIEIYATLPKRKGVLKTKSSPINIEEDGEYMLYGKTERESRSLFSRSRSKEEDKVKEKRSRSEDRNKISRDFSLVPTEILANAKDTLKRDKYKEEKDEKKDKEKAGKKQHKVRRKLLMGGLIRRKNRSMPDLTEGQKEENNTQNVKKNILSVDDSSVGTKGNEKMASMCGYLSEGHLEFTGNSANPNLERSRLMRKSFHGSAGKILTAAKVPPPPPLRTTSQLSTSKSNGEVNDRPPYPLPNENPTYSNQQIYSNQVIQPRIEEFKNYREPQSLPYLPYEDKTYQQYDSNMQVYPASIYSPNPVTTVVTQADVHQEQSPIKEVYPQRYYNQVDSGVDEVDCLPPPQDLDLPPYPSPMTSIVHSRQASEDFPPPPTELDLSALDEHLQNVEKPQTQSSSSLLAQLQQKRQQILAQEREIKEIKTEKPSGGETWLKELQAKQAALKSKKIHDDKSKESAKIINHFSYLAQDKNSIQRIANSIEPVNTVGDAKVTSVKDLASRFEQIKFPQKEEKSEPEENVDKTEQKKIDQIQIAEEIKEVEMLNAAVTKVLHQNEEKPKKRIGKKKSVSFCDQVILVATAEDQEDDSYIPNPILERVLRSALNKPETAAIQQEIRNLREEMKKDDFEKKYQTEIIPLNKQSDDTQSVCSVSSIKDKSETEQNPPDIPPQPANYPSNHQTNPVTLPLHQNPHLQQFNSYQNDPSVPYQQYVPPYNQNQPITPNNHLPNQNQPVTPNNHISNQNTNNIHVTSPNVQSNYHTNQSPVVHTNIHPPNTNSTVVHQNPSNVHQNPPSVHQNPSNIHQNSPNLHQNPQNVHQNSPNIHQNNHQTITNVQSTNAYNTSYEYQQQNQYNGAPQNDFYQKNTQIQQNGYNQNGYYHSQPSNYQHNNSYTNQIQQNRLSNQMQSSPNNTLNNRTMNYPQQNGTHSVYQRVPPPHDYVPYETNQSYQRPPPVEYQYQRSEISPYQRVPQVQKVPYMNGDINVPYQNQREHQPLQRTYPENSPYQRVPQPNETYQRVPRNEPYMRNGPEGENQPYQRVPPPHSEYRANGDPYQRQNGEVRPGEPYQRIPNEIGPYQKVPEIGPYQRIPNGESYQRVPPNGEPYQRVQPNGEPYQRTENSPYQRVPPPNDYPRYQDDANQPYQRICEPYQRTYEQNGQINRVPYEQNGQMPPYQYALPPKQVLKKSVHFEPGTKGGAESPTPKATVAPLIVNSKMSKCNLCRKKPVVSSEQYCNDCEFYMSRFKPKV